MATYRFVYMDAGLGQKPELTLQYYPEIQQIHLVDIYQNLNQTPVNNNVIKRLRTIRDTD